MDLVIFEENKPFVLEALQTGEFDSLPFSRFHPFPSNKLAEPAVCGSRWVPLVSELQKPHNHA